MVRELPGPPAGVAVALTGARGFLGRRLSEALAASGVRVTALVRPGTGGGPGETEVPLTDAEAVAAALSALRPAVLFHLAGATGRGGDPGACLEGNVLAALGVLRGAAAAGVPRVVTVGSADEYGDRPGPLREDAPLRPLSPYGTSKAAATALALALHRDRGLPVVVLRPFTVYGPGQPAGRFLADALAAALVGRDFEMTEGRQRRDFVYVADVVQAFLAAGGAPGVEGGVFNVGSGKPVALREAAALLWELAEARGELRLGARPASAEELCDTWADTARARAALGWEATTTLREGLTRMVTEGRAARG